MRSIEDKGSLNLASTHEIPGGGNGGGNFEFQKGSGANRGSHHHRTALGKPTPSKWDDAQKWLVNLSRVGDKNHSNTEPRDSNADDRRLIAPVPKKDYPSSEDEEQTDANLIQYGAIETKKVDFGDSMCVRSICVRDMGTEMTPMASQEPSRSATPVRATTPAARSPIASGSSTPVRPCPNAASTVAPKVDASGTTRFGRESEETYVENVVETRNPNPDSKLDPLETRAMAWDEAERAKYMARIAEEKRAKAEAILNEKAIKTCERADYIRRTGHLPSSFSIKLPSCCCW
ncbi:Remorin, C-terminal [Cynara cardunculus var. scolymus]|uniref:Remorin, C-terminal n=1 Tax=Cynara cardunculus var. scolymus TaxID=59895 RepID=A0A103XVW6_CYNCS|nr:Remorin, C-terminal [Cynara cardunculus var. scolymus]